MIGERGYERRSASVTDAVAQMDIEGGRQVRAAVPRPTLDGHASKDTRISDAHDV